jgi:hypothetical protein
MEKASRRYLADVKTHVEFAVQVHSEITNTLNRLDDDAIDVDTDVGCMKTLELHSRPKAYEFRLVWIQLKTPCSTPTLN